MSKRKGLRGSEIVTENIDAAGRTHEVLVAPLTGGEYRTMGYPVAIVEAKVAGAWCALRILFGGFDGGRWLITTEDGEPLDNPDVLPKAQFQTYEEALAAVLAMSGEVRVWEMRHSKTRLSTEGE